jgi:putative ABC transport system ATP-binding protein
VVHRPGLEHEERAMIRSFDTSGALFTLRHVTQERGGAQILCDVSLDLRRTAITALIGPSGSGKTSLLRLLNRLDDPSAGDVCFEGRPITDYPVAALRRRIGFVFQTPVMFPGTVADNLDVAVALGGRGVAGTPPPDRGAVLEAVGLGAGYADREAAGLSGGERQRVSIARALMTRPEVLLLDEPTSALDPEVAELLLTTVEHLSRDHGLAVVMVTHRLTEARQASTCTVMLEAGKVLEAGATEQVFTAAASARTRAYLAAAD